MSKQHILESLHHARQIYQNLDAQDGPIPSFDALFTACCLCTSPRKRAVSYKDEPPADWFTECLKNHAGKRVTIGKFMFLSGRMTAGKTERNKVGAWLRQSGREPRKIGGEQVFVL